MIRTREQRQADRDWCNQFSDFDEVEAFGDGIVLAMAIGAAVYVVIAAYMGWLSC